MNFFNYLFATIAILLFGNQVLIAQIELSKPTSPIKIQYVPNIYSFIRKEFIGKNAHIRISNIEIKGHSSSYATFSNAKSILGIDQGLVLSTGNAYNISSTNLRPDFSSIQHKPGDSHLDYLAGTKTYDAVVLEFDFVADSSFISFNFVFASEEYPEYVGSKFNDAFGFFLTHPDGREENLAVLPENNHVVTVNSINYIVNKNYYINNTRIPDMYTYFKKETFTVEENGQQNIYQVRHSMTNANTSGVRYFIEFDGFTRVLQAKAKVIPKKKYHIKIAIADARDSIYDSAVFIETGSFMSHSKEDHMQGSFKSTSSIAPVIKIDTSFVGVVPAPPKKPDTITVYIRQRELPCPQSMPTIYFAPNSVVITEIAQLKLIALIDQLSSCSYSHLVVNGFADASGSHATNYAISKKRADSVRAYLISKGLPPDRIHSQHFGHEQAIGDNSTEEGRNLNRRVEILLKKD